MFFRRNQTGVTLIEVVITVSVITAILLAVGLTVKTYLEARAKLLSNAKALYLAEEGYEMLRMLRDEDWNNISSLTIGDTYYLDVATTSIGIVGAMEVVDVDFTRSFVVSELTRDGDDDVDLVGGSDVDAGGRVVTVTVNGPSGTGASFDAVLTNLHPL